MNFFYCSTPYFFLVDFWAIPLKSFKNKYFNSGFVASVWYIDLSWQHLTWLLESVLPSFAFLVSYQSCQGRTRVKNVIWVANKVCFLPVWHTVPCTNWGLPDCLCGWKNKSKKGGKNQTAKTDGSQKLFIADRVLNQVRGLDVEQSVVGYPEATHGHVG